MLSATVIVDLDHDATGREAGYDLDRADRHALEYLDGIPDGARLVVIVGNRSVIMPSSVGWLAAHCDRLDIEINARSPQAARRWYDAIKGDAK